MFLFSLCLLFFRVTWRSEEVQHHIYLWICVKTKRFIRLLKWRDKPASLYYLSCWVSALLKGTLNSYSFTSHTETRTNTRCARHFPTSCWVFIAAVAMETSVCLHAHTCTVNRSALISPGVCVSLFMIRCHYLVISKQELVSVDMLAARLCERLLQRIIWTLVAPWGSDLCSAAVD